MADPTGKPPDPLIAELGAEPWSHDFFLAVRRLQSRFGEQPRIGHADSPAREPVRFAQSPAIDFAPSAIEDVKQDDPERPPVIVSRHFGLFGPNGPLPLCLTEYAHERMLHHGDKTFAAFCNVFHHRLQAFFFRAWANARKVVDFDRPDDSHWAYFIGALIGLGQEALWRRDSLPDRAKFYYAGRLVQQTRNAEGLEAIVQDYFGIPTELQTFVGRRMQLPPDCEFRLGVSRDTCTLGVNAIIGETIWDSQLNFRLRMGPMSLADFMRMLPTGESFRRLCDWVHLYAGHQFHWDLQLVLAHDEVPATQLGVSGRLGWMAWLKTQPFARDPEDLIVEPAMNLAAN
ncbi:MAG TPA: type VI secretion system baseplate subunit TssG [Opitutaceae bacterium]